MPEPENLPDASRADAIPVAFSSFFPTFAGRAPVASFPLAISLVERAIEDMALVTAESVFFVWRLVVAVPVVLACGEIATGVRALDEVAGVAVPMVGSVTGVGACLMMGDATETCCLVGAEAESCRRRLERIFVAVKKGVTAEE